MAMPKATRAIIHLLLCCATVYGAGAEPGGDRDQAPEDLIAVVKVGKTYYSNEPLTEDGRGVLYPVPERLFGALGLPKPSVTAGDTRSGFGGYTEAEEMKLSLSETRRQPRPGPSQFVTTTTTARAPAGVDQERGYVYKKPEIPFRYPSDRDRPEELQDFEADRLPSLSPRDRQRQQQQQEIDSNELDLDFDSDLRDRQQQHSVTSTDKSAPAPALNQQDIRVGPSSRPSYVAKDIPTFDSILKGAGVEDDLQEGDEFTGFATKTQSKGTDIGARAGSRDKDLGTQSQFFNANIRDLLYHRGKSGNGNGDRDERDGIVSTREPALAPEFDRFALFVPNAEVRLQHQQQTSPSTSTSTSTTTAQPVTRTPSTRRTTTTKPEYLLDVRTVTDADDERDNDLAADVEARIEQGYGTRKQTSRPRLKQSFVSSTRRSAPTPTPTSKPKPTTTTEESLRLELVSEETLRANELETELEHEQLESPVETETRNRTPEQLQTHVTTITTHISPAPAPAPAPAPIPTLHIAPTIDLSGQVLHTNMNDIMRQIYAPIQQQLPFIPVFDSIQPAAYLPFMQQQHQVLIPMHQVQAPEHLSVSQESPGLREALFASQVQHQQQVQERPASIEDLYARGNGIVYGRDLVNEAPIAALRAREYDFSAYGQHQAQVIDESIRAETYVPYKDRERLHHHQKDPSPLVSHYSQTRSQSHSQGQDQDFQLLKAPPTMVMFTPADAMTRRPPIQPTNTESTTSREYPNTHY